MLRFGKKSGVKAEIYINFGKDTIRHHSLSLQKGSSVLDALSSVSDVLFTPDDSATGHCGSVVTSIDGARSDLLMNIRASLKRYLK